MPSADILHISENISIIFGAGIENYLFIFICKHDIALKFRIILLFTAELFRVVYYFQLWICLCLLWLNLHTSTHYHESWWKLTSLSSQLQTWMHVCHPTFPVCMLCLRPLWCYKLCTVVIHFRIVETCVSKPKQNPLPVVLLPKKGPNKYSDNLYSFSVTLQHSH